VDKRSKDTRKTRWERLDEDLESRAGNWTAPSSSPRKFAPSCKPGKRPAGAVPWPCPRPQKPWSSPKTTTTPRTSFASAAKSSAKGNDFCKKITYNSYNAETKRYEKSETLIQEFRTSPQLRIAVTVDMIATGTDIKPLECLIFMRDVKSRVYFEQMKGRGTRVLSPTDLQAVSGAEASAKTHFVIVDAVGVCESDKTDSRPLEKKPGVSFEQAPARRGLRQARRSQPGQPRRPPRKAGSRVEAGRPQARHRACRRRDAGRHLQPPARRPSIPTGSMPKP